MDHRLGIAAAAIVAGCLPNTTAPDAQAAAYNSDRFDLADWKLTLPEAGRDDDGDDDGDDEDAAEVEDLIGYEHPSWFYTGPDGAMVFVAEVDGATTSGSRYPRSELREMRNGDEASWRLGEGGTLTATLTVDAVPSRDDGEPGRVVVGQIHGEDEELVRLYYQGGTLYFVNDRAGPDDEETRFELVNAAGEEPDVELGERFSYLIDARGETLTVEVHADDEVYGSTTPINDVWQSDRLYFKAGLYLGVDDDSGSGVGRVSFYALDHGHAPGSGRGGLR